MQKIEFLHQLDTITKRLHSKQIIEIFRTGFNKPNIGYDYGFLKPLLFRSKSQFDQIMTEEKLSSFIKQINGIEIYDENNMSSLTSVLVANSAAQILINPTATKFYSFHSSMIDLLNISKQLLSNELINKTYEENLESGVIIFQIKIGNEGLPTSKYIKIFSALEDLVRNIEKALKMDESESEIVLLDSGSDTNVGLETKVEVAKLIFQMFKEIWDFITSLKFYRTQQRNQALLESLSIRREILKSVEEGVLTEDEAREYIHIIKTRTDDLISMNVLPRVLTNCDTQIDSAKILEEYRIKVLEEKIVTKPID